MVDEPEKVTEKLEGFVEIPDDPPSTFRTFSSDTPPDLDQLIGDIIKQGPAAPAPVPVPVPVPAPAPAPASAPAPAPAPNFPSLTESQMERLTAEQEAGRAAVARRQAEKDRAKDIQARTAANRLDSKVSPTDDDLAYNPKG